MGLFSVIYVTESSGLDVSCKVCGTIPPDFQSKCIPNDAEWTDYHFAVTKDDAGVLRLYRVGDPDKEQWWIAYTPEEKAARIAQIKSTKHHALSLWMVENEDGEWKENSWELRNRRFTPFEKRLHQHVFFYTPCPKCGEWNEWRLKFTDGVVVECVRVPVGEES